MKIFLRSLQMTKILSYLYSDYIAQHIMYQLKPCTVCKMTENNASIKFVTISSIFFRTIEF